jgi:hypothetical protein
MKQSKLVTVPKKWKTNELAYITPAEKKLLLKVDLHGNLQDGPHKGPGGVMSLNGWGDKDRGTSDASYGGGNVSGPGDNKDYSTHKATGQGGQKYTKPKDTVSTGDHTGKVVSALGYATNINPLKAIGSAITWGKSLFTPKTEQQKVEANIAKGYDVNNPAEMHRATQPRVYHGPEGNGDGARAHVTTVTQSLVSTPTADKGAGFGHQWDFQAYPGTPGTTYDPKVYAKHGKMISKYGTGQEVKNFSKGKRFGPPPLKGPDPQGLQTLLENSDYFKKLIG